MIIHGEWCGEQIRHYGRCDCGPGWPVEPSEAEDDRPHPGGPVEAHSTPWRPWSEGMDPWTQESTSELPF